MAERLRYLLAYDIRDAKRLRRVHNVAKDFGFPLQYSVFVCDLSAIELIGMKAALVEEVNTTADSIAIFDLGSPTGRGIECIEFIGARRPVEPSGEAAVW